jgi:hypothetical protein
MPNRISRLRLAPGEPLGLHIYQQTTFLNLPREIRDTIYCLSLVTSDVITIVSKNHQRRVQGSEPGAYFLENEINPTAFALSQLAISLLRCSRLVSQESACIFYRSNTFRFLPEVGWENEVWECLYAFLQGIGSQKRGLLQYLEVGVVEPEMVWQYSDGSRSTLEAWKYRETYFYDPEIHGRPNPLKGGQLEQFEEDKVHHVDPAIRPIFRILGSLGEQLTISLILREGYLPGVKMWRAHQHTKANTWSMELPHLIEKFRKDFCTSESGQSRVSVVWKGGYISEDIEKHREAIRKVGWNFVSSRQEHRKAWFGVTAHTDFVLCVSSISQQPDEIS